MNQEYLFLLVILGLGLLGHNHLIIEASVILLALKILGFSDVFPFLDQHGLNLGLLFLVMAIFVPFAYGRVKLVEALKMMVSWGGFLALVGGAIAAYLGAQGIELLKDKPDANVGLMVGTIIGCYLLRGVPMGPLAAAGVTALFFRLFRLWK
ncbi:MAG TPA: DUF441 domain-containing protein [Bacillota bacterium]